MRRAPSRSVRSPSPAPASNAERVEACRSYACCSQLLGYLKIVFTSWSQIFFSYFVGPYSMRNG